MLAMLLSIQFFHFNFSDNAQKEIEQVAIQLQGGKTRQEFYLSMEQHKQGLLHKAVSAGRKDLVEVNKYQITKQKH